MNNMFFLKLNRDTFLTECVGVVWHFLPSDAILTDCRIPKEFAEKQYTIFDKERKNAEALQADIDDQKAIEILIKKGKSNK